MWWRNLKLLLDLRWKLSVLINYEIEHEERKKVVDYKKKQRETKIYGVIPVF